jgi:hypothetical protein
VLSEPGHRRLQHRAPHHRLVGLDRRTGHDGLADVLTRLAVVWIRGRRLTATGTPVIAAPARAGAGA